MSTIFRLGMLLVFAVLWVLHLRAQYGDQAAAEIGEGLGADH